MPEGLDCDFFFHSRKHELRRTGAEHGVHPLINLLEEVRNVFAYCARDPY